LLKEKDDYFSNDGQSVSKKSRFPDAPNVYSFEGTTKDRIEKINSRLRIRNPAAQDNTSMAPSLASLQLPGSDRRQSDLMNLSVSQFSQLDAMSSASRRSNLTMITLRSQMTNATGKNKALPREPGLRDTAIRRMNEGQLKEIENHLRKLRNTTDLSYSNIDGAADPSLVSEPKAIDQETLMRLIDECKEEEDRLQVINNEEEDDVREQLEN